MCESGVRRRASGVGLSASGLRLQPPVLANLLLLLGLLFPLLSCSNKPDPATLVMLIESSPTNLDPRVGIDAQSERIDALIFDDLLSRGNDLNVAPGLAERWDVPDPLTYIFHLHKGVKFQDGRPLTSRDVKWTFDALLIAFIGGVGTTIGPLLGAIFYIVVREELAVSFTQFHQVIFGVVFILIVLLLPGGLIDVWHRVIPRRRPTRAAGPE